MFEPITLNSFGVKLYYCSRTKMNESSNFFSICLFPWKAVVGEIITANGVYYDAIVVNITETHKAICCEGLGVLFYFPTEIQTIGQLRNWCKEQGERQKKENRTLEYVLERLKILERELRIEQYRS